MNVVLAGGRDRNEWIGTCRSTCPDRDIPGALGGSGYDMSANKAIVHELDTAPNRVESLNNVYKNNFKGQNFNTVLAALAQGEGGRTTFLKAQWENFRGANKIVSDTVGYKNGKVYFTYADEGGKYISIGMPLQKMLSSMGCPQSMRRRVASRIHELYNPPNTLIRLPQWNSIPKMI